LQRLAESSLAAAELLLRERHFHGTYYLTGFAVECALKARLSRAVQQYDYPDKKFVLQMYNHELEPLAVLDAALWAELQNSMKTDPKLLSNWQTVRRWDDEKRYDFVEELEAKALYDAVTEAGSGVMEWIQRRW
jgi:hypothetical protein